MNDQLDRYLNRAHYFAHEIKEKYPSVWDVAGEAIAKSNEVMHTVHNSGAARDPKEFRTRLGLWGSVRHYQVNSLLEIFSRNLDEGLSILRMATELTRALKAITADATVYAIWVKGDDRRSPNFKAAAKFDLNDPVEKAVFDAYNFCSSYGTHGHKTSAAFLVDTFMGKEPNLKGVATIAKWWFISYVPMHRLCLKCCTDANSDVYLECDLALSVVEARLLERAQNDAFFNDAI